VSSAAGLIADKVGARVIITFTQSGFSAQQISRHRYSQEVIVALSPNQKTLRKLNFCWGVHPQAIGATQSFDHVLEQAKEFVRNNEIIKLEKGESYVIVAGLPFNRPGATNLIHVDKT
jgi:pyruvate kinase